MRKDQKTGYKGKKRNRWGESGNVFFTLFGAVALVGMIGAATATLMRGPLGTVVTLNQRAKADAQMQIGQKLALLQAARQTSGAFTPDSPGDCDNDTFIEPLPPKSASCSPSPTGGGCIPDEIGASKNDPWGTNYGYCAWDHGATTCGITGLLDGENIGDKTVISLISAGPDRAFQLSCADAPAYVSTDPDSDDIVLSVTYDQAAESAGGLWYLKSGSSQIATIDRDVEISKDARFKSGADFEGSTMFNAGSVTNFDAGSVLDMTSGGLFNLPTQTSPGSTDADCTAAQSPANLGLLRVDTSMGAVLQICDPGPPPLQGWINVGGTAGVGRAAGSDTQIQFNDNPNLGADADFTWNKTTNTLAITGIENITGTLNVSSNTTVGGTFDVTGNLAVNTNQFNVDAATGNTLIAGTLGVTGATTLSDTLHTVGAATLDSTLDVTGDVAVNTDKFNITAATGNTAIAGDVAVATNKFNIAAATGNTLIAGTLGVTGATTLSNTLSVTGISTFLQDIQAKTGADADPGVTFTADASTGLYLAGGSKLGFTAGGVGAMWLDSTADAAGRLGIGTATPTVKLDVYGAIRPGLDLVPTICSDPDTLGAIRYNAAADALDLCSKTGNGGGVGWVTIGTMGAGGVGSGGGGVWTKAADNRIYYNTANVGIGTATPAEKLEVNGNIRLSTGVGAYGAGRVQAISSGDVVGYTLNSNTRVWDLISITSSTPDYFAIRDNTAATNRFAITEAGNVGIGTTTPGYLLDVNGTLRAAGIATFSSNVQGITGTANSPAYAFSADMDTGLFRPVVNSLGFTVGGVEAMRIDPSRALLVGTQARSGALLADIEGPAGATMFCDQNGANCFSPAEVFSGGVGGGAGSNRQIMFNNNGALAGDPNFVYLANGNMGLGTASPNSKLYIQGSSTAGPASGAGNLTVQGGGGNGLLMGTLSGSPYTSWIQSGYTINFGTAVYSLSLNPLGGNVGIGTTSPGYTLDVSGNARITGTEILAGGSSSNWGSLNIGGGNSINAAGNIYSYSRICAGNASGACSSTGGVVISPSGSNVYGATYLTGSGNSYFNGGNVGIGTTAPAVKLDIVGTTNYQIARVTSGGAGVSLGTDASGNALVGNTAIGGIIAITPAGNVGVGTTGPTYKLHVVGTTNITGATTLGSTLGVTGVATFNSTVSIPSTANPALTVGNGTTGYLKIGQTGWYDDGTYFSPLGTRHFYIRSTVPTTYIYSPTIYLGSTSGTNVYLRGNTIGGNGWSMTGAGTLTLNGTITSGGVQVPVGTGTGGYIPKWTSAAALGNSVMYDNGTNIGIGTASPGVKLHVVGTGPVLTGSNYYHVVTSSGTAGQGVLLGYNTEAGRGGMISGDAVGGSVNNLVFAGYNGSAWGEKMRLLGNGNFGIGTAAPSYKLHVAGDIYANGGWLRVSGNTGLYFESWGGGWFMQDSTWIRSYNSKPVFMSSGYDSSSPSGVGCGGGLGGGYTFQVCGSLFANNWVDRNNTGYYMDLDGTSRANYLGRNYGWNWTEYDWNDTAYYMDLNNVSILNDVRANIFYDKGNTGYYVDPASTSVLNSICAGGSCSDYLTNDGTYMKVVGDFRVSGTLYNDSITYAASSMRSPIFYDLDNTGYYTNPASTSRLNAIQYDNMYYAPNNAYGFLTTSVYADTINTGVAGDPLELNYVRAGDIRFTGGDLTMNTNRLIYPGTISGLSAFQKSYYIASHASWGLYTNTSFNAAGGLYDAGSRVAISRGEGRNFVDYSRYIYDNGAYQGAGWKEASSLGVYYAYLGRLVYNNGAYSGSGWIEPSDLGVRYANSANSATYATYINTDSYNMKLHWSGQGGQPTWLWGSNNGADAYVWNPSNFSVNYANSAGSAGSATNATNATYGRYVYNNGAYSGSGWVEPSDLGVRYANSAGSASSATNATNATNATYGRYVYNNGAYSGSGWVEPSNLGVRYAANAGYATTAGSCPSCGGGTTNANCAIVGANRSGTMQCLLYFTANSFGLCGSCYDDGSQPPGCAAGYQSVGVAPFCANPNDYVGTGIMGYAWQTTVNYYAMSRQILGWGCPAGYSAMVRLRFCSRIQN